MLIHLFLFRWTTMMTPEAITRVADAIAALQDHIPGIVSIETGTRLDAMPGDHDFGGIVRFTTADAYAGYAGHPAHLALLEWLLPLIEPIEFDFQT